MWHQAFATKCLHKRKAAADWDRSLPAHVHASRWFSDSDATRPRIRHGGLRGATQQMEGRQDMVKSRVAVHAFDVAAVKKNRSPQAWQSRAKRTEPVRLHSKSVTPAAWD